MMRSSGKQTIGVSDLCRYGRWGAGCWWLYPSELAHGARSDSRLKATVTYAKNSEQDRNTKRDSDCWQVKQRT